MSEHLCRVCGLPVEADYGAVDEGVKQPAFTHWTCSRKEPAPEPYERGRQAAIGEFSGSQAMVLLREQRKQARRWLRRLEPERERERAYQRGRIAAMTELIAEAQRMARRVRRHKRTEGHR